MKSLLYIELTYAESYITTKLGAHIYYDTFHQKLKTRRSSLKQQKLVNVVYAYYFHMLGPPKTKLVHFDEIPEAICYCVFPCK